MPEKVSKAKLLLALPVAIVVGILNVLLFVLFMVVYSYAIDPGHDQAYYQEAANRFGPTSSIVCGMPLMYLAGRWIGKRVGPTLAVTAAVIVWTVYFVLDVAIIAANGILLSMMPILAISFSTKLAAACLGGRQSRSFGSS